MKTANTMNINEYLNIKPKGLLFIFRLVLINNNIMTTISLHPHTHLNTFPVCFWPLPFVFGIRFQRRPTQRPRGGCPGNLQTLLPRAASCTAPHCFHYCGRWRNMVWEWFLLHCALRCSSYVRSCFLQLKQFFWYKNPIARPWEIWSHHNCIFVFRFGSQFVLTLIFRFYWFISRLYILCRGCISDYSIPDLHECSLWFLGKGLLSLPDSWLKTTGLERLLSEI